MAAKRGGPGWKRVYSIAAGGRRYRWKWVKEDQPMTRTQREALVRMSQKRMEAR